MMDAAEYRKQAAECRALARQMLSEEQKQQLLAMADTWELMALTRETASRNHLDRAT